ncbi:hypothetical protein QKZ77_004014 [Salmonella enterica]|nr:hypothetical protein [Salmonella enterica]
MKKIILKNVTSYNHLQKKLYRTNIIITGKRISGIKNTFDKFFDMDDIFPGDNYIVIHGKLDFYKTQFNPDKKTHFYFNEKNHPLINYHMSIYKKKVITTLTPDVLRNIERNIPANLFFFNHFNIEKKLQYSCSYIIDFINNFPPEKLMINGVIFNLKNLQELYCR